MSEAKNRAWWESLTDDERTAVLKVQGELPPWMVESLLAADIAPVSAQIADGNGGYRDVFLRTTLLADFLRRQRAT